MKKILAGIISTIAVVALCLCMTACSTGITGTYKFSKMSVNYGPMDINIEAGKEYEGEVISEDDLILEIKEDNTYTIKGELTAQMGGEQSGTWEEVDGKYYLVEGTEKVEITLKGSTLVLEQSLGGGSMSIEFKK